MSLNLADTIDWNLGAYIRGQLLVAVGVRPLDPERSVFFAIGIVAGLANLHPISILITVLISGRLFGLIGMLLGVPLFSIVKGLSGMSSGTSGIIGCCSACMEHKNLDIGVAHVYITCIPLIHASTGFLYTQAPTTTLSTS